MTRGKTIRTSGLKLTSPAFEAGKAIPAKYTCDGANVSPPLFWEAVPKEARSLALICDDPDCKGPAFVHWVIFNVASGPGKLDEHLPTSPTLPDGAVQGVNDFGKVGYGGPCPPGGVHRYFFKLYAVDKDLDLDSSATKQDVLDAIDGHVVAQAELMGTYQRAAGRKQAI